MKSELFTLKNISHPGRVHAFGIGEINLAEADDETLKRVWAVDQFHLELTEKGREVLEVTPPKPITIQLISINKAPAQVDYSGLLAAELRVILKEKNIAFPPRASKEKLLELLG